MAASETLARPAGDDPDPVYRYLRQAADWYAVLRDEDVTEEARRQWRAWLDSNPQHARAWQRVEAVSRCFAPLHEAGLATPAVVAGAKAARRVVVRRRRMLVSLLTLAGGALGTLAWRQSGVSHVLAALNSDMHTATGEQRQWVLADGTQLWLNTSSAVNVDFAPTQRTIELREGEILIETGKDAAHRPFYVETHFGRLQALGTRFAVRQHDTGVRVDVYDGVVEVRNRAREVRQLPAGQGAWFDATEIGQAQPANPSHQAWVQGLVMADNMTVAQLAGELSRYWPGYIHVDPSVAGLRVMGVYPANDMQKAAAMISSELPVQARRPLPWWMTLSAK